MAHCPNKNLESWKLLVASRGEVLAYYLWDKYEGKVPESESNQSIVKANLKAVQILNSDKAKQVFDKGHKNNWTLDKILSELAIPKEQKELIKELNQVDLDKIITDLLANYSYTIEINTAKDASKKAKQNSWNRAIEQGLNPWEEGFDNDFQGENTQYYSNLTVPGGTNYTENEISTPLITPSIKGHAQFSTDQGIGWFRSDNKQRSIDKSEYTIKVNKDHYTELYFNNKLVHTVNGEVSLEEALQDAGNPDYLTGTQDASKTRRILEVQSDLFQKGRDKKVLSGEEDQIGADIDEAIEAIEERVKEGSFTREYADNEIKKLKAEQNSKENQFLQLLNKDSNWVTFFVKSIIQDSAKKGYEKVLFPTGNTASKVEGHTTLEEFKKQKEDRIKELEKQKENIKKEKIVFESKLDKVIRFRPENYDSSFDQEYFAKSIEEAKTKDWWVEDYFETKDITEEFNKTRNEKAKSGTFEKSIEEKDNEINQLKQELERVETEGFGALKPIYNFYENTVKNILKKSYPTKQVTDEYNNTWIEVNLDESHLDTIHFQKAQGIQSFDEKTAKEVASALQAIYPEISLEYTELQGVRGQANIQAGKVLIDSLNQNTDTLAHEYAHHYISWFKNSPIVQKGIRLFGSEEALVQAIGEQTVAQKAKANIWYKQFWNWIKSLFNDKQAQLERLTDSFISKKALGEKRISTAVHNQAIDPESIKSDEKLIKTINAAKLVFKNRQAELEVQYGADKIGTRESIRRIKAALDKLTWAAAYSDIISVAEAQLDVVKNILDKDYDEISNSELVDARKILYFTKEFDELLEDALHDEALAKKLEKIRSETIKVKNKFSKFVTKRLVDSSKYYGSPITPEQLSEDAAYKDVSKAKAAHMSLESTNIPHLQFAASVMNWRTHQTDAELNQFDREHRDLVKKFGEEEFKKILDAQGRLISMYSHDFYDQETSLWRAYYDVIKSKGTKQEVRAAKQALDDWYEQNYTYELTPEGEERYNKDLEDLTQAHKFDGEVDQDAVEKFKQQYHWSTKGKVNEDRSFTITENGTSRARIGEQTVFGDKWHTYLNRTPLEKYKNADFEKVKDLEAYKWYISKVQEVLRKLPRTMTIELGMYDKAIHQISLNLTDSKFSLNNIFKGLKEGSLEWYTVGLTLGQITGEGEYLTDEKGRVKPIIKPTDMEHIQNRFQYKNPIDLLRKAYDAATTYEHMLEIQPILDLAGDALEKANKLETNFLTNKVRKNLNGEPITTAGGLAEAINMFKYREKAELTGQTRTDENSGLFSDITDEEKAKLAKEREEWVQAGMIGEEPKLRRASWIKISDALVDFTRLNLIGLRPLGAIANFSMGTLSNYVYAAREKDFNSKDLDWAVLKLRDNVLKFYTGSKVVTKEAMKIGALSLKFGVVKDTFIEDAKEYGKEKVYKKITEVLFKLQESGEYLIANQILLAKMHNTVIKNLAGKDKTLYDAFDEFGDWKTEEFGEAPEWTKLTHLNEDGLNVSKLTAFRKELDLTRYRTQGDYTTPMAAKGKFYGRIYTLFRTWLPRAIEERFGAENTYTGTKGRVITVGQGFSKSAKEGVFKGTILKYLGGATAVTLAKLTNLPIIGKHIAPNPLARNAVKAYEEYLHEIGMSDLDVENMRAQLAEIRIMILISAFALLLKGLAGDDDDDPELNFTLNTLQRVYQDLSFFTFPSSAFAIIKDPVPIKKTIEDAVEALHATAALISDPEKDIYRRGLRKGRSKTAKEWKDLFPVLSAWQSTESTFDQVFNADAYKYTGKK